MLTWLHGAVTDVGDVMGLDVLPLKDKEGEETKGNSSVQGENGTTVPNHECLVAICGKNLEILRVSLRT